MSLAVHRHFGWWILAVALAGLVLVGPYCGAASWPQETSFDGRAALEYVRAQLAYGPRVPGTESHRRAGDWIEAEMRRRADTVLVQRWTHLTGQGDSLPLRNILARFRPDAANRVLYITHWDSRPVADNDTNVANRARAVPGANDGASGVGLFVALADVLQQTSGSVGVDLLFVDGEDYGDFLAPGRRDVLIGSQYFIRHLPDSAYAPLFGVVWDMIGDANLRIRQEGYSVARAPEVVQRVWRTAASLGYERIFVPEVGIGITDDHLPFLDAGFRVIDVIDLDFRGPTGTNYHHTIADTIDKLSASSLQVVGDVALSLIEAMS